ncbi:MAG: beta-galactosidase [Rikenellaceae bacterium]
MKILRVVLPLLLLCIGGRSLAYSPQSAEESARAKIVELKTLVSEAQKRGFDTQREECVVWMAEEFLDYATWDEQNIELNTYQFSTWDAYKENAAQYAEALPEFERTEVVIMLDDAIAQIEAVMAGEITRRAVPEVDWSSIKLEGDQFMSNGEVVFLNHFNRLPSEKYNPFCGMVDRVGLSLSMLENREGDLTKAAASEVKQKERYSGNVFIGHGAPPKWMIAEDPDIMEGKRHFTSYDIDNPLVREMWSKLMAKVVPQYAGKIYTDQGYILANEPHWVTIKDTWAAGNFSIHTINKFREWLEERHKTISRLNELWGSDFDSFDSVEVEIPFEAELRGTPKGYDIMMFNQDRCTEWFEFLADGIKEYDPNAKVHVKAVPRLFRQDIRDHGMDLERITELSDIIGNDGKITGRLIGSKTAEEWEANFCYNWMDVGISFDYLSSVSPNKANINSESHYLSSSAYRDLYLTKEFTRSSYWLSTIQGQSLSYTWFWARDKDGAIQSNLRAGVAQKDNAMAKAYVGSVVQQPRVTNEVTQTYMDLNAFNDEIAMIQRLRRPIRLFYSETSAINIEDYMEKMIALYTPLFFEGNPVGFATERIINRQDNELWDVILVRNSNFAKEQEISALQSYLDNGGTIIIDNVSLKMNEYGEPHTLKLRESKGKIIRLSSIKQFINRSIEIVKECGSMPNIVVKETNNCAMKGCLWRVAQRDDNTYILNVINIGAGAATIELSATEGSIKSATNMLNGKAIDTTVKMDPHDVLLVEVKI